jgi:hypothetical protein
MWATPVVAATCALSAPSAVNVGAALNVNGTGFPASAAVDIEMTLDAAAFDSFTVQSDSSGAVLISLTPEAADEGELAITATSGSSCSTQVVVDVLPAGAALPAPEATGETAGESGGAPRTDSKLVRPGDNVSVVPISLAGWVFIAFGVVGLLATAPRRQTRSGRSR